MSESKPVDWSNPLTQQHLSESIKKWEEKTGGWPNSSFGPLTTTVAGEDLHSGQILFINTDGKVAAEFPAKLHLVWEHAMPILSGPWASIVIDDVQPPTFWGKNLYPDDPNGK